ncbi:MAG: 5-formyltetrahydrofolate cyclo-ligase, partial [Clostridiales bacterium]|nr:5-formyltetrahydrofolate cyclo-ligase [Clostridiales bacterium]
FGIAEPDESCILADPSSIDMIILPAVAYNDEGVRLGMGGGYYDRFCSSCNAVTVGICYDFQINSSIPVEDHDLCVDYLFVVETEDEL